MKKKVLILFFYFLIIHLASGQPENCEKITHGRWIQNLSATSANDNVDNQKIICSRDNVRPVWYRGANCKRN